MNNDDLDFGATLRGLTARQHVFNRYVLTRQLGRGGMGVVWLAHDEKLERDVALKFLPEEIAQDADAILDMKRETRRALELTHPRIVRIYDFVDDSRRAAVSMEYVDGPTLSALRREEPSGCLGVSKITPWIEQLCEALVYAHGEAKIAHRDLKPANLMLDSKGSLKITDFGISATISDSTTRASHSAASTSGTPVYMSPQQMMGEKPTSTDDIYSLGATIYELLTGKPPFYSGNIPIQVQNKVAPSMTERRAELGVTSAEAIPQAWEETVAACLSKESPNRPQSAEEVWERLNGRSAATARPAAKTIDVETPKPVRPQPRTVPAEPSKPRNLMPVWITLLILVLLGSGAGWYFGVYAPEQRRLEMARGGIVVKTNPAGAEISVGGVAVKQSPATFGDLHLGEYEVKVSKTGYEPKVLKLAVEENRFADPGPTALQPSVGSVALTSTPSVVGYELASTQLVADDLAQVRKSGRTPATLEGLPIGQYKLVMQREGWPEQTAWVDVGRGTTVRQSAEFSGGSVTIAGASGKSAISYRLVGNSGISRSGTAPAQLDDLPPGDYTVTFICAGWNPVRQQVTIAAKQTVNAAVVFPEGSMEITSLPDGVDFELAGGPAADSPAAAVVRQGAARTAMQNGNVKLVGKTPATLDGLPVGSYTVSLLGANGWPARTCEIAVDAGSKAAQATGDFSPAKLLVESDPSGAEVWSGGKLLGHTPYTEDSIGPGKREVELRLTGYLVKRDSGEAQPCGLIHLGGKLEDDYWVRRAESLTASMSAKDRMDATLSLLGFWAKQGMSVQVDQCGQLVLQRIGQMKDPCSLSETLNVMNEHGYRDLCGKFAAIALETVKKEKNAADGSISLLESLHKIGDAVGYAKVFPLAQELVRKSEYPTSDAMALMRTEWKLGDKPGYAQAFALAQELVRKDEYASSTVLFLKDTAWELGDKETYIQACSFATEIVRNSEHPGIYVRNYIQRATSLDDNDGYDQAFALAEELVKEYSDPTLSAMDLMQNRLNSGDEVGYKRAFALAQELVRNGKYPDQDACSLMEKTWELGDKAGYAQAFALAQELVRKNDTASYLMEKTWELGDKAGYAQAFALAQELVRKGKYPVSYAQNLMKATWKLGDKAGYAQAFALAQELVRKDDNSTFSAQDLMETVWTLGDREGYNQVRAYAESLAKGSDYAMEQLRKKLVNVKFGETKFGETQFGQKQFACDAPKAQNPDTVRYGKTPFGARGIYEACDKRMNDLAKAKDWAGLAAIDVTQLKVGADYGKMLEQTRFNALAEAGQLQLIAPYVQRMKAALNGSEKKSDWELMENIEFAIYASDSVLAEQLIAKLEKKDDNDADRILLARIEKATWDGDFASAERFYAAIKDAGQRSSAAYTLAKAYALKGNREAVERLIASFPEKSNQFSIAMTAANACADKVEHTK
jgi:hypothetical protein